MRMKQVSSSFEQVQRLYVQLKARVGLWEAWVDLV